MKIFACAIVLACVSCMPASSFCQVAASSFPAVEPSAAQMEKEIAAMQKKLADWPQLDRYRADNAALGPVAAGVQRVVFFGDSITDAWGRMPDTGEFFPGEPYVNRGISGQTTEQMVVRFRQDVIDLHPSAVVILAGTNDVAGNTGPMTPEMTEENWKSMADLARANGIRVIFASVLPSRDFPWRKGLDPAPKIRALNNWLQGYCVTHSLIYLDYYTPMAAEDGGMKPGISKDGVHPNTAGYAIMAPLAEAAIRKALK